MESGSVSLYLNNTNVKTKHYFVGQFEIWSRKSYSFGKSQLLVPNNLKDTGCTSVKTPLAASYGNVPVPPPVTYVHVMPCASRACTQTHQHHRQPDRFYCKNIFSPKIVVTCS